MKRLFSLALLFASANAFAQAAPAEPNLSPFLRKTGGTMTGALGLAPFADGSEPHACSSGHAGEILYSSTGSVAHICNGSSWTTLSGSGSVAFSSITAGTSAVALVIGTSGSLATSGSGTIVATSLATTLGVSAGGTGRTSLTSHGVLIGNGTSAVTLSSVGSTNTLLHGNSGADPTFSAVDLANDVSGNLAVSHFNSGTSASSSTYWRGDGTWAAISGGATTNGGTGSLQLGSGAGAAVTSSAESTTIGVSAGNAITSNTGLTAFGYSAGFKSTGSYGTFVGDAAGPFYSASSGGFNTGIGALVLQDLTGGTFSFAGGYNALTHVTSGNDNVGVGFSTGTSNGGAPNSVNLTTGSDNILLGPVAGVDAAGATNRLALGPYSVAKVNNTGVIGSAAGGSHYTDIYFGYGYDKASIGTVTVGLNATGGLGTDQPGASLLINGGVSTGTGSGGRIGFQISPASGSTASSRNALVEVAKFTPKGHLVVTELSTDPGTSDLSDAASASFYRKNDKLVFAINIGGTINYMTTPADGVGTAGTAVWTWSTSAP